MSKQQMSKKATPHKALTPEASTPAAAALKYCEVTQARLAKHAQEAERLQSERRNAVRKAFAAGATTRQLSAAVKVSRAKIYQLLGSAKSLKA